MIFLLRRRSPRTAALPRCRCLGQRLDRAATPNFFSRAVEIEKRMMFLILLLIVAVAAFNIVSTLVMAVTDKRADIAILRTLGPVRRASWPSLSCRAP